MLVLAFLLAAMSTAPRTGTARSADGVAIHYEVQGTGEPALVFVHGWAIDSRYWAAQVPVFAARHRVVTLDLAGHGRSGRDRQDWTVAAFGEDVRAVVEAFHLAKVVLIGHSMSGNVILEAAHRMPDRVVGLIPIDTLLDVDAVTSEDEIAGALAAFRADYKATASAFMRKYMFTPRTAPALVEEVVRDAASFPPEIGVPVLEHVWRHDPRPLLRGIKAPIVAVNADLFPTRLDHARQYAPQFDALLVHGVGHYLMREDPAAFNAQLVRAVARVTGTAEPGERR